MPESVPAGVEVLREGALARIVLDRPRALNALDTAMVRRIREVLQRWRPEPLRAITIESSTPGVFCAGGDVRRVRQDVLDGQPEAGEEFFTTEYEVNEMLATCPVPVVALIDGLCLGGGMGLCVHGPFRVVTERASLGMPETAIGFFPDVGASHFLPRLPGAVGTYLALTGARLGAGDALEIGLATHHVTSERLPALPPLLAEPGRPVEAVLRELASTPEQESELSGHRGHIDAAFTANSVQEVLHRLAEDPSDWAARTRRTVRGMSPQSLEVTMDLLLWGRQRSLRQCLDAEGQAARHVVASPDFAEGVRAALVDKDRSPRWSPSLYRGTNPDGTTLWADEEPAT